MGRHRRLPEEGFEAEIEKLTHDGRGIARVAGKAVFLPGGLPGERVRFRYTRIRRDYACGEVEKILIPIPERVPPPCHAHDRCGGCSFQHVAHDTQILIKQNLLVEQLRRIGGIQGFDLWPPLQGAEWGYRRKARLGVRYVRNKGRVLVGFRERASGKIAEIDHCRTLHPQVGRRLQDLGQLLDGLSIHDQVPQIEVAVGENRSALVFRVLSPPTHGDKAQLAEFGRRFRFDIHLQPKGPDSLLALEPEAPPLLCYHLPEDLTLWFGPLDFIQVNGDLNRKMVHRVLETLEPKCGESVLDLFCGLGNFTLPLARRGAEVTGVEGNPGMVARGRYNAAANGLDNVHFHCTDLSRELDQAPWARRRYDKVLLDPARGGALEVVEWLPRWQPRRVVYVSCNPATLARDVGRMVHEHGFKLLRAGIMDMFPHTTHVESIALLEP